MALSELSTRPATQDDRRQLDNLIHFEPHVHRHLDWRRPLDWIGHSPFWVAEKDGRIRSCWNRMAEDFCSCVQYVSQNSLGTSMAHC